MNMRLSMMSLPPEVTYSSPCTEEKTERIEEIQALGLAPKNVASDDAYALALNKPEHPGRVRGLGYEAVPSKVFGESACIKKRSRYDSSAEVATLKDQLRQTQEKQSQMEAQIQFLMSQLGTSSSSAPVVSQSNQEQIDLNVRGNETDNPLDFPPTMFMDCYVPEPPPEQIVQMMTLVHNSNPK